MPSISYRKSDPYIGLRSNPDQSDHRKRGTSPRPGMIEEVSEPSSPHSSHYSQHSQCESALAELIRKSTGTEEGTQDTDSEEATGIGTFHSVTVREGIISQPGERTTLLPERTAYGTIRDIESQKPPIPLEKSQKNGRALDVQHIKNRFFAYMTVAANLKSWTRQDVWRYGISRPASLVPSVILGLLLNVLDALSYGQPESGIPLRERD